MIEWSHTAARVLQCGSCFIPTEQQKTGIKNPTEKRQERLPISCRQPLLCNFIYFFVYYCCLYQSRAFAPSLSAHSRYLGNRLSIFFVSFLGLRILLSTVSVSPARKNANG